jgi:hypothetical protein
MVGQGLGGHRLLSHVSRNRVISGEHHLQTTGGGLLLHFLCVRSQPILLMPEGFSVIVGTPFERIR